MPNELDEPEQPDPERVFQAFLRWIRGHEGEDGICDYFDQNNTALLTEFQSTIQANQKALEELCSLKPEHCENYRRSAEFVFEELANEIRPIFESHQPPWYRCGCCEEIFIGNCEGEHLSMPLCYSCNNMMKAEGYRIEDQDTDELQY